MAPAHPIVHCPFALYSPSVELAQLWITTYGKPVFHFFPVQLAIKDWLIIKYSLEVDVSMYEILEEASVAVFLGQAVVFYTLQPYIQSVEIYVVCSALLPELLLTCWSLYVQYLQMTDWNICILGSSLFWLCSCSWWYKKVCRFDVSSSLLQLNITCMLFNYRKN